MMKLSFILMAFIIHLSAFSQGDRGSGSKVPCTNEIAQQARGRWIKTADVNDDSNREINALLLEFHRLMTDIYPQPTGVDAAWHLSIGMSYFGVKRKLNTYRDGALRSEAVDPAYLTQYFYACSFLAYTCDYIDKNKMNPGWPEGSGTIIQITANEASSAIGGVPDDLWLIDGLLVHMKPPVFKKTNGHEFQYAQVGSNYHYVLIHRKDVLPYTPVTRKQYLDRCLIITEKILDDQLAAMEKIPVRSLEEQEKEKQAKLAKFEKDFGKDPKRLKSAVEYYLSGYKTDQQVRDEQIEKEKKLKIRQLKKFTDELEKTNQEGLLDSPAMIRVLYNADYIFDTDPLKASMLVVENPSYIRKDLPKHVPQFIEVWWTWSDWAPQAKLAAIIEDSKLFDKLQGMVR